MGSGGCGGRGRGPRPVISFFALLIPTDLELTGPAYGRERANGFVASDFVYSLTDEGLLVQVEDRLYAVHDGKRVSAAAE